MYYCLYALISHQIITRNPCYRKETARCCSCCFPLKVRRRTIRLKNIATEPALFTSVQRKLTYYGHTLRAARDTMDKDIIVGTTSSTKRKNLKNYIGHKEKRKTLKKMNSRHRRQDRVKDQHSSRQSRSQTSLENYTDPSCHRSFSEGWHMTLHDTN